MAPPGIAGKNPIGTVNGAMGLGIPESSKSKDAAWDYIKFLSSPAIEAKYAASSPPIWKSFYEEAEKQDRPDKDLMAAEAASFNALSNRPQVPEYQQFSARLQQAIQQALLGKATPEDALNAAASELSN
jgi:multiple sugar transport system substrate-binding protein